MEAAEAPTVFECGQCGHCCNTWKVPIESQRLNALLEKPWVRHRLSEYNATFETIEGWGAFLPHKPNQECLFWEDAVGCLIHHHEGAEAKPLDCQRFPFSRLPDSTLPPNTPRYDVSAACSTIASTHIHQWKEAVRPSALEAASATESQEQPSPFYPTPSQALTQYPRYPWPFHRYQTLQANAFQEIIRSDIRPLFHADEDEAITPPLGSAWQALNKAEALLFNKAASAQTEQPPAWWAHHQLSLWLRSDYGNYPRWQWRLNGRYQDAKLFGATVITRQALNDMYWGAAERQRMGRAFVFHLLRRESALAFGSSLWHHVRLARLGLLLFEFYAPAFAVHEGVNSVEAAHMELAIRCIERYYTAHQPRVLARLEASPWLML